MTIATATEDMVSQSTSHVFDKLVKLTDRNGDIILVDIAFYC